MPGKPKENPFSFLYDTIVLNDSSDFEKKLKMNRLIWENRDSLFFSLENYSDSLFLPVPLKNLSLSHIISYFGSLDCLVVLYKYTHKINIKTDVGYSPIHYAIIGKSMECLQFLVSRGALLGQAINNKSLLYWAVSMRDLDIVNFLFDCGLYLNRNDIKVENSPINQAIMQKDPKILEVLLTRGVRNAARAVVEPPLFTAIATKNKEAVEFLLKQGANPNIKNSINETPLHLALKNNEKEMVNLLLEHKANVNMLGIEKAGAIHMAAQSGNADLIKIVNDCGANAFLKDAKGRTAIFYILKLREEEAKAVLECLIELGLDLNQKNADGKTLLEEIDEKSSLNTKSFIDFLKEQKYTSIIGNTTQNGFISKNAQTNAGDNSIRCFDINIKKNFKDLDNISKQESTSTENTSNSEQRKSPLNAFKVLENKNASNSEQDNGPLNAFKVLENKNTSNSEQSNKTNKINIPLPSDPKNNPNRMPPQMSNMSGISLPMNPNMNRMPPPMNPNMNRMPPPMNPNMNRMSPPMNPNMNRMPLPMNPNMNRMPQQMSNMNRMPPPMNPNMNRMSPPMNPNMNRMPLPMNPNMNRMPQQMSNMNRMPSQINSNMSRMPQQMSNMNRMPSQINSSMSRIPSQINSNMSGMPQQMNSNMSGMSQQMNSNMSGMPQQMNSSMSGIPSQINSNMSRIPSQMNSNMSGMPQQMNSNMSGMPQQMSSMNRTPQQINSNMSGMPQQMNSNMSEMPQQMNSNMSGMTPNLPPNSNKKMIPRFPSVRDVTQNNT